MELQCDRMIKEPIKYFSMFSGIGGFEYGMEQSRYEFENVGYSEIDKYAVSIYERHYPDHVNYGDATRINTEDLRDFDLLVGGFPCQAFSIAGKRRGFDDTRGTLFFEIARILKDKRPKYLLFENVKGLLSHDKGRTFQTILEVLSDLGYNVQWTVYNSKDYGVPQNRERIFIKGYSGADSGQKVLHFGGINKAPDEPMSNTYYGVRNGRVHKEDEIMNTLTCSGHNGGSSQLIQLNNNKKRTQSERVYDSNGLSITLNASANNGFYKINVVGNVGLNGYKDDDVLDIKGISKTLTATGHQPKIIEEPKIKKIGNVYKGSQIGNVYDPNGLSPTHCAGHSDSAIKIVDGYTIRKLTPVECERLQGFPDNWTQYGKDNEPISDTQRYKCCGNAVTTNVITAIINEMFDGVIESEDN